MALNAAQVGLLEEPVVAGAESIGRRCGDGPVIARCAPNENSPVSRQIRERVKTASNAAGSVLRRLCCPVTVDRLVPVPEPETLEQ